MVFWIFDAFWPKGKNSNFFKKLRNQHFSRFFKFLMHFDLFLGQRFKHFQLIKTSTFFTVFSNFRCILICLGGMQSLDCSRNEHCSILTEITSFFSGVFSWVGNVISLLYLVTAWKKNHLAWKKNHFSFTSDRKIIFLSLVIEKWFFFHAVAK